MRLTLIISTLSCGGAERVASIMANYWAGKNWPVTLLTFDSGKESPFYELDPHVSHKCLDITANSKNSSDRIRNNSRRLRKLRAAIKMSAPDAIISFMDSTNVLTLLSTRGLPVPVIATEHLDPEMYSPGRSWVRLRFLVYPLARKVVLLSHRSVDYFRPRLRTDRICVIPNPILPPPESGPPANGWLKRPAMLGVGRLTRQKGFDLLLRAFASIKDSHAEWHLTILGEGPMRPELESLAAGLGLSGRVSFPGAVKNIYDYLKQADLFVLSSRYEGFPVALGEAMSCGLPSIAMDCRTGPSEMVRHRVDGLLVADKDERGLAAAMDDLMRNESERARLGARAKEIIERFSLSEIMKRWELLLAKVVNS